MEGPVVNKIRQNLPRASSNIEAFRHHFVGKRPDLLRADFGLMQQKEIYFFHKEDVICLD